ncbi:ribbon-helix-helix domain-containing protein [Nonlabens antarcticus]|uniref:ribbon-helix-helix domain-containing protein n=1 Tax=Nonlabens antarcticus TaxID=392714 RepID=UPI001890D2C9|nr:ribbon-helix-helix domain-containing protein [Nonlabens antarcticus]
MATFTSSLPDDLLKQLADAAKEMKLPKNKLIEKALSIYLEQIDKAKFINSYKRMAQDPDMLALAEEGMADYMQQLEDLDDETT